MLKAQTLAADVSSLWNNSNYNNNNLNKNAIKQQHSSSFVCSGNKFYMLFVASQNC